MHHTKKPDLDKLVRAVKDALTGIAWNDDSQVIEIKAHKRYVVLGEMPAADIQVMGIEQALNGGIKAAQQMRMEI